MPPLTLARDDLDAVLCERGLRHYIKGAWSIVEPGAEFVDGWHIGAISEHLEAVSTRQIRNLIINIPPRHMKSLCVSVFWPTYDWGPRGNPASRWLFASYNQQLAVRDSLKCRRIIDSPWYQRLWGDRFRLTSDQNQKMRYENDRTGYRYSFAVSSAATGEGGDYLVIDDPHKVQDQWSDTVLESSWDWFKETWSTRGNDPKTVCRVIIMQRISAKDLTGRVLSRASEMNVGKWEALVLPAEYEPTTYVSTIGWKDPRNEDGDLLWPQRFGRPEIEGLKAELGPDASAGQLQQRPAPRGGAVFKDSMFQWRPSVMHPIVRTNVAMRFLSLDTAFGEGESSAWSSMVVGELLNDNRLIIRHTERDRLGFPGLVEWTKNSLTRWNKDGRLYGMVIENKASGKSLIQTLHQVLPDELSRFVYGYNPIGDKEERAQRAAPWCANGSVILPQLNEHTEWLPEFYKELTTFPACAYKDYVDAFTQIVDWLVHYLKQGLEARLLGQQTEGDD